MISIINRHKPGICWVAKKRTTSNARYKCDDDEGPDSTKLKAKLCAFCYEFNPLIQVSVDYRVEISK